MSKESFPGGPTAREARAERAARRKERAAQARRAAARLSRPLPLPPHPEGLRPPIWPPLAALAALMTLLSGAAIASLGWMIVGIIALGLVVLYARLTRDDPKRQLLYAYVLGRRQFSQGDYQSARNNFMDMEDTDFSPPSVLRGIALSSYQLGLWSDAVTYLEDVPDRSPEEDAILAQALVEVGEHDEALRVLAAIARETPAAGVARATVQIVREHIAPAIDGLRAVLDAQGGAEDAPFEEPYLAARYWLSVALEKAGCGDEARALLRTLYEIEPEYQDVARRLGVPKAPGGRDEKV